ncbi:hypothetical protein Vi05172_g357 [Venturia inaequalis]|uniref:Uncharacterized protein n=1 Tax=Venturia inaequalis TaxID=5025 RepID=A0A8H3V8U2_VENIN|nr:hypothetical protein EG327_005593 [Venturia inaequalis]RDI89967.1 hypothetical protein Vi05172_g357 [Venturia inaequalis]
MAPPLAPSELTRLSKSIDDAAKRLQENIQPDIRQAQADASRINLGKPAITTSESPKLRSALPSGGDAAVAEAVALVREEMDERIAGLEGVVEGLVVEMKAEKFNNFARLQNAQIVGNKAVTYLFAPMHNVSTNEAIPNFPRDLDALGCLAVDNVRAVLRELGMQVGSDVGDNEQRRMLGIAIGLSWPVA